ncbi:MAG: aminotransferase class V-fold PLP-dependent enzyme [Candidatus Latescibacter sp.]|nr:aminotransferase class V-fold PLP-dependent enzyme [Candidatus Latescibacter sp.]
MKTHYYFDHNATTPIRPEVLEAMMPFLTGQYGNASSPHALGQAARRALEDSRSRIAALLGAEPDEIVFTGCGTESDNIAITGSLMSSSKEKNGLVTTLVEHSAVLNTGKMLEKKDLKVVFAGVDSECRLDIDFLRQAVGRETGLVSIMFGNNETGVIQPIREAAETAHAAGALFHTDAVQAAGKIPIHVKEMGIDMLSMSAHKMNAPKGLGLFYIRRGIPITPLTYGGHHEHGIRPGTENVAGIVGFARAFELAVREMKTEGEKLSKLRDRMESSIENLIPDVLFNGRKAVRLPGTSNISFLGVDGEALLISMDMEGLAVSTGSACTSGEVAPSHVLVAMGVDPRTATSSLRFSMGWGTTDEGVDHILEVLPGIVNRLRRVSGGVVGECVTTDV